MATGLTQARLRELLDHCPETGEFNWKVKRKGRKLGCPAGSIDKDGYIQVGVDGRQYRAHRLVWFYVHGKWPPVEIDHKDLDKTNNRLSNLREATHSQNSATRLARHNIFKGVYFERRRKHYVAQIVDNGNHIYLGSFPNQELAGQAYALAAKRVHGEFAGGI